MHITKALRSTSVPYNGLTTKMIPDQNTNDDVTEISIHLCMFNSFVDFDLLE